MPKHLSPSWKSKLPKAIQTYLEPHILTVTILGFASGLPLTMVFSKLSFWLREEGIDRAVIGGMYVVSLAYSLKFLWSPAVDHINIPVLTRRLGKRRSWMFLSASTTALGLFIIGTSSPKDSLLLTTFGALILAYGGATLDVCVDAWRIESAPDEEQANMAAAYTLGYRLAIVFSGLGMVLAGLSNWSISYYCMALAMTLIAAFTTLISEPSYSAKATPSQMSVQQRIRIAVVEPFLQIAERYQQWLAPVMLLVVIYRLSDFTMGVMASPFYADLGYDKAVLGLIKGFFGPWPTIAGAFLAGIVVLRYRIMPALLWGSFITVITNGAFALLAIYAGPGLENTTTTATTPPTWALMAVLTADNIAGGFVGTTFVAYLSSLTDRKFAATQYALLSSGYSLIAKSVSIGSGLLADSVGWKNFFLITAAYAIPSSLLILYLMVYGPSYVKGTSTSEATG